MQEARDTELGVELLQETLAQLREQGIEELIDANGAYAPGKSLATHNVFRGQNVSYTTPGYTAGDPTPSILTLELTVGWTADSGQDRELSLVGCIR